MAQGTIGLRFNVDVANSPAQVDNLTQSVASLNDELTKATEDRDWKAVAMLTKAMEDATSARGRIMQQANQAQNNENKQNAKGGIFGGNASDVGKYLMAQSLTKLTETVVSALEKGFKAAEQRASGDYAGAAITEMQKNAGLISGGAGLAAGIGGLLLSGGNPFVASLASQLTEKIVSYFSGKPVHEVQEDLAYSAQYRKALPEIDALNQLYGGAINRKTEAENNRYGLQMHRRASEATAGTGLTTQAFIEAMKKIGGYGISSETMALNMAKNQALWSRFTGTDLSTIQKYAGQAYRFGGETGAVSTAYGGLMAQGMAKGQFSEFLNSMERILEEGIAKGFVRSSEEIAGNMAMLYKLSGGSRLWQGEQGAQRLSQMNNAISNATNLQSVEDVISFGVARDMLGAGTEREREETFKKLTGGNVNSQAVTVTGDANFRSAASSGNNIMGTVSQGSKVEIVGIEGDYARVNNNGRDGYIHKSLLDMQGYNSNSQNSGNVYTGTYADIMQLLERGVSADLLKGQFEAVNRLDGNNTAAIIERFKTMYGLNYTGASQVWGMMRDARGKDGEFSFNAQEYERQIKALQANPQYVSDSEKLQTALNKMTDNLVDIGKFKFDITEYPMLVKQAQDVEAILAKLNEPPPPDPRETLLGNLPVAMPERGDSLADIRASMRDGKILQALLTAPQTNEGRYHALANVVTGGVSMERDPHAPQEYWDYMAATMKATGKISDGGTAITSNELRELIPVLRNLADALKKSDLFEGKTDEEIHVWLTSGQ